MFFIDQEATKIKGTPITWLDYKAWQFGPVSPELFYSKNKGFNKFSNFVNFDSTGTSNACMVKPIKSFDNSEFSDWDLEIIEDVLKKYGKLNTDELVQLTHEEGSLWDKAVKESKIRFSTDNKTSDISLDFLELIDDDNYKKSIYYSTLENLELKSTL